MTSMDSKRIPRNDNFSLRNRKKSYEHGGRSTVFIEFHNVLRMFTIVTQCDGALSSWKIQQFFLHNADRFCRIFHANALILFINRMAPWNMMHRTTNIKEINEHHFDFWATLAWFFRFYLIFTTPFRRLLACLRVKLVDPSRIANYDALHDSGIGFNTIKHVHETFLRFCFWRKFSSFGTSRVVSCRKCQVRMVRLTREKCWGNVLPLLNQVFTEKRKLYICLFISRF